MTDDSERIRIRKARQKQRDDHNAVGKLPLIKHRKLRSKVLNSLEDFLTELFPDLFSDPFGEVQKSSIAHEQQVLENGSGNINKLEPRGYGKSTRSILGSVWACLKGVQDFVMVCCDSTEKSTDLLKIAHNALGENEKLLGCFPELHCFHLLDGNTHRGNYQTYKGKKTKISIKGDTIYFPVLGGKYKSEGAMIVARPFRKARGKNIEGRRPTVVILDDIQSSEEADSPTGVRKNLKTLTSDIAFLGTRKRPVAIINNATVISPGDYPSRVAEMPAFTTVRYKMVKTMPKNEAAWEDYHRIRYDYDSDQPGARGSAESTALKYYKKHRKRLDEGSEVTWDYAFSPIKSEISTIQAAMNFISDFGMESFLSECQNAPQVSDLEAGVITAKAIANKQHAQGVGAVPLEAEKIVVMIDVQGNVLFDVVMAGNSQFDAYVVDYGTFPRQKQRVYTKARLFATLGRKYKGTNQQGRIYAGLREHLAELCERKYKRSGDKSVMRIDRIAVDARFETDTVIRAIRDNKDPRVFAFQGWGIRARHAPMSTWKRKPGERNGGNWFLRGANAGARRFISDVNFWKYFCLQHFAIPLVQPGSLSVFAVDRPDVHELFASHMRSELGRPIRDETSGRLRNEYEALPGRDNDLFDCVCGCLALLSYEGAECIGSERVTPRKVKRKEVTYL